MTICLEFKFEQFAIANSNYEKAARRVAMARNLPLIGTMGIILLLAKRQGELENVKSILDQMQQQGTRISDRLYQVLILAEISA